MKRLLAYSSIENMGLIVMGLGLAVVFAAYRMPSLAALALTAMLYHCLNHAIFKSLLFLGTGSVLHATHERSLGKLGGLMRSMPWVLGRAGRRDRERGLPSQRLRLEWLLLQGLPSPAGCQPYLGCSCRLRRGSCWWRPAGCDGGFFGVIFLGRPARSAEKRRTPGPRAAGPVAHGAASCWGFSGAVVEVIDPTRRAGRARAPKRPRSTGSPGTRRPNARLQPAVSSWSRSPSWPHNRRRAPLYHGPRRAPRGIAAPCTARMQDTAKVSASRSARFEPFFRGHRELPAVAAPRYRVRPRTRGTGYLRIGDSIESISRVVGLLQRGRISIYLLYSFLTLVALLFLTQV